MSQHDTQPTEGHPMNEPDSADAEIFSLDELLTGPEIAYLANRRKMATFERWRLRNQGTEKTLPEPFWHFGLTPVWKLDTITEWLDATSRAYDVEAWRAARDAGEFRRRPPTNAKAS